MRNLGLRAPLRRPLFRRLLATYSINEMGDWMGIIALSLLVYEATHSAYATAALFIGTRFLPALLAPLLVTRAEKPPPRRRGPLSPGPPPSLPSWLRSWSRGRRSRRPAWSCHSSIAPRPPPSAP